MNKGRSFDMIRPHNFNPQANYPDLAEKSFPHSKWQILFRSDAKLRINEEKISA
ncbi:hypothetical protein [Eudoraea sp.]|uniref:hypothetical protein n=1 Tax=Eudoraea sp. TaxID=1979955 RepID=UPI003C726A50